jgi:hypothetical protein
MIQFRSQAALAIFVLCSWITPALGAEPPMPNAYPGAEILFAADEPASFFEISLGPIVRRVQPIAMSSHQMSGVRGYYGAMARRHYKIDDAVSTSEVHTHYADWFTANGFVVLLDARGDSPMAPGGTSWALRAYGDLPTEVATELSGTLDKSRRLYLVAEKRGDGEHTVVTVLVNPRRTGELRVQLDLLTVDTGETARAFPTRAQLYERLMSDGRVHVGGIQYVGKKAVPRDSCDALLSDLAALLGEHGELRLEVVGHVTMEGGEEAAANLAFARAQAVADLLIIEHGVAPRQLEARAAKDETDGGSGTDESGSDGVAVTAAPPLDGIEFVVRR